MKRKLKWSTKFVLLSLVVAILCGTSTYSVSAKTYKVKKIKWSNVKTKRTMYKGTSKQFKVKITPSKAKKRKLQWYSSNKKVVKVSSKGVVKAVGNGTAYVTVRVKAQKSKKVRCKIKVKTKKVSSVKFKKSNIVLQVGKTSKQKPSVSPSYAYNKKVTYTSSNKKIATVSSSGKVTAKSIGTATITAKAKDGSKKKGSYKIRVIGRIDYKSIDFIAHRGLSSQAPENTVYAFELAGKEKYWGAETDVRKTKDDKFVLVHEPTLQKMCDVNRRPEDMTFDEIRSLKVTGGNNISKYKNITSANRIASLQEYLEVCKKYSMVPLIEIKVESKNGDKINMSKEDLELLYETVQGIMGENEYTFTSFDLDTVVDMYHIKRKRGDNNIKLRHIVNHPNTQNITYYKKRGIQLDCDYRNVSIATLQRFQEAGLTMCVWTIDDQELAWDYIQAGADYITTNTKFW